MMDRYLKISIPNYCPPEINTIGGVSDLTYKIIKSADNNMSIIKKSRSNESLALPNGHILSDSLRRTPNSTRNDIYEIASTSSRNTGTKLILHRKSIHLATGRPSVESLPQHSRDEEKSISRNRTKSLSIKLVDEANKRYRPSSTPIAENSGSELYAIRKRVHRHSKSTSAKKHKYSDNLVKTQDNKLEGATNGSANVQSAATLSANVDRNSEIGSLPIQSINESCSAVEAVAPNVVSDSNIPSTAENRIPDEQESLLVPMDSIKTERLDHNRNAENACSEMIADSSHTTIKSEVQTDNSFDISIKSEPEDVQSTIGLPSDELIVQNSATRTEISMSNMGKPTTNGGK